MYVLPTSVLTSISTCIARLQCIREKKAYFYKTSTYPEYKYKQKITISEYRHADH
jgi:hypothetical protein